MSVFFFFFKQKTAYEIYQCDWSSDVCSSDLTINGPQGLGFATGRGRRRPQSLAKTLGHILRFLRRRYMLRRLCHHDVTCRCKAPHERCRLQFVATMDHLEHPTDRIAKTLAVVLRSPVRHRLVARTKDGVFGVTREFAVFQPAIPTKSTRSRFVE